MIDDFLPNARVDGRYLFFRRESAGCGPGVADGLGGPKENQEKDGDGREEVDETGKTPKSARKRHQACVVDLLVLPKLQESRYRGEIRQPSEPGTRFANALPDRDMVAPQPDDQSVFADR